ncbi:MAG: hypothetical protein HXS48_14855 [Theionarchaea archaeon]|nr:hypothetical protein [Theionarchaea archaeon]
MAFYSLITRGILPLGYGIMGILLDGPAHVIALVGITIEFTVVSLFIIKYLKEVSKEFER